MKKMKAALWYGPEDMRVEETDIPQPGPGEVLVKIGTALTCGTDFKLFRRGHPLLVKKMPSPCGHEMAGHVESIGPGVTAVRPGDAVVAANSAPCKNCFFCRKDQENLCEHLEFLNGAFAEYVCVPARIVGNNLYKLPSQAVFKEVASAEPLACVLRSADANHIQPGETVCIIGAGSAALMWIQVAKIKGARVICLGRTPEKLVKASECGADITLSTREVKDVRAEIYRLANNGYGPDLVVEAAGQPETWELAIKLVRKGGRVCFYGGCRPGTQVNLDTQRMHYDELSLLGTFHHTPEYFQKSIQLINEKKIRIAPLIAGEKKLENILEIFKKGEVETPLKFAIVP